MPLTALFNGSKKLGVRPEKLGMVKRKGNEGDVNASLYQMGDTYAAMLSCGLK